MNGDFLSTKQEIIELNEQTIASLSGVYAPYIFSMTGSQIQHASPNAANGLGAGKVSILTPELLARASAGKISSFNTEVSHLKSKTNIFSYDFEPFLVQHNVSKTASQNNGNVLLEVVKHLTEDWDAGASWTQLSNGSVAIKTKLTGGITIGKIMTAISQMKTSLKNQLSITDLGSVYLGISDAINAVLDLQTTNGDTTNRTAFEKALEGIQYRVVPKIVLDYMASQSSMLGANGTFTGSDGFMHMTFTNNQILHYGVFPQLFNSGENAENMYDFYQFAYQNAAVQSFKQSNVLQIIAA